MAIHIHPLDIPPRYYKPIGQIVASWNLTEALVCSAIWHIHKIRSPKVGRLFTQKPGSVEKLKMFKVTLENFVNDPALQSMMKGLHDEANDIRSKRNNIVHGLWGRMPKEHTTWKLFYHKDTDDTFLLRRDVVDLHYLRTLAARTRKLNINLKKLLTRIGAPPP